MSSSAIAGMDTLPVPPLNKRALTATLLAGLIALIVYLPALRPPFFAEDPLDLGQVRYSTLDNFLTPNASDAGSGHRSAGVDVGHAGHGPLQTSSTDRRLVRGRWHLHQPGCHSIRTEFRRVTNSASAWRATYAGCRAGFHRRRHGQLITDRHGIVLPPTSSSGTYQIVSGVCGVDQTRIQTRSR